MVISAGNGHSAGEPFPGRGAGGHTHGARRGVSARACDAPGTTRYITGAPSAAPARIGKGHFSGRHFAGNAD
ncbi:MAG: hypothetical protein CV087_07445 [Candidatus Brocadia sp. WS118]|nr:MAG: hypothetical protein CV087_07445 [Candidatus Brocadia sp. WS118]